MLKETWESCRRILDKHELDVLLLRTRSNFAWFTGGSDNHIELERDTGVADLLVFRDKVQAVTAEIEARRIAEEELSDLPIEVVSVSWTKGVDASLVEILKGLRVGSDVSFGGAMVVAEDIVRERRVLGPRQIEQYSALCRDAAEVLEGVAHQIEPGMPEFAIGGQLMAGLSERGCTPHVVLVATDDRLFNYRHPIPTTKPLEKYAMMVVCARRHGLIANVTRFVHFGTLPQDLRENREKCAYIDTRMNVATRPGTRISDVFNTAIEAYAQVGFPDDWRLLHQGGPTAYASREFLATPDTNDVIREHEAYAWNPAVRGIKSEDTILVEATGNRFLTQTGNWPSIPVEYEGVTYHRPDILVR